MPDLHSNIQNTFPKGQYGNVKFGQIFENSTKNPHKNQETHAKKSQGFTKYTVLAENRGKPCFNSQKVEIDPIFYPFLPGL